MLLGFYAAPRYIRDHKNVRKREGKDKMKRFSMVSALGPITLLLVSACSPSAHIPQNTVTYGGDIPVNGTGIGTLEDGTQILIRNYGGKLLHEVHGTFSNEAFLDQRQETVNLPGNERAAKLEKELSKIFSKVSGVGGIPLSSNTEIGYFTFLLPVERNLMRSLKSLGFDRQLLLNAVTYDPNALSDIRAMNPRTEGLTVRDGRVDTRGFSGLERIKAPEFVEQAQNDIGGSAKVDGSRVNLGITDTGLTYNHPTFLNAEGKNRITYMKDFTSEGRVYFSPTAKLEVTAGGTLADDEVQVTFEYIATPRLPNIPAGDALSTATNVKLKVSAELKALLTTTGTSAKLGLFDEDSLQGEGEQVDFNANGKLDDKIPMILVPGATAADDTVYLAANAEGDFRNSKPLKDFTATGDVTTAYSEKFGFDIKAARLPNTAGDAQVQVRSASIVGYDPGNHGSHVAGIAAGRKTISNDSDLTLARGVAPNAKILLNRVCSNNAGCNATEAMIDIAVKGQADVINMSLGGLSPFNDGYGVQETVLNRLTQIENVLFVVSAGNSGPGRQTVGSPSTARLSLSVGASASRTLIERQYQWPGTAGSPTGTEEEFMLFFSSRGPTANGGFKPNVAAPGTELSSVQLNSARGSRAGMDVYWGTSMAAPTATGAVALLLDAVRKYNDRHPDQKLTDDMIQIRGVIIDSARPFDVKRFDPATGEKLTGQYTWIDEGTGLIDLLAAWKKLFALRASSLPPAVRLADGTPVALDYEVITSLTNPTGVAYDGTRVGAAKTPAFGTGIYLDAAGTETLRQVHISRKLPAAAAARAEAGELNRQLVTTADEFALKTVYYGSDKEWLKVGVQDSLNCATSDSANLTVLGRGAEVVVKEDGTGTLNPIPGSILNLCIDRAVISRDLPQGDNGALISAYRMVGGQVEAIPSFVVPVYVTVPHQTLRGSTAFEAVSKVESFGVGRNYVRVPKGTSVLRITLEVPAAKVDDAGRLAVGESCSGVEAMIQEASNVSKTFTTRAEARVVNCESNGTPAANAKRKITLTRANPAAGIWDLHVFGIYKYRNSNYKLRVDYITAVTSLNRIEGGLSALTGSLDFTIKESSLAVYPDSAKSSVELNGFEADTIGKVAKAEFVILPGVTGKYRSYPIDAQSVTITTGGSPGNDIDLIVLSCDADATGNADEATCEPVATSGGATDVERAGFKPKAGKLYGVRIEGYDVKDDGNFTSGEFVQLPTERGSITVSGLAPNFVIAFEISAAQLQTSRMATDPLFTSGKYQLGGALTVRSADDTTLGSLLVKIKGN